MISPYDSRNKFILINPKYNQPTYFGSRFTSTNTCGLLSNIKRRLIINQHTYKTNGVGTRVLPNFKNVQYNENNSVKIGNIIYIIPPRFCKYKDKIRELVDQNMSFNDILNTISQMYPIIDNLLLKIQPSIINPTYRYPSYNTPIKNYKNVADFNGPFKMGDLLPSSIITAFISSITFPSFPNINIQLFPDITKIRYVYVACNDGIEYTTLINDMKINEKASFWGGKLSTDGIDLSPRSFIPVLILPINDIKNVSFGILYATPITFISESKLIFIPLTSGQNFIINKKDYYENMLFNIKTRVCRENLTIDYTKLRCKYAKYANLFANSF